MHTQNQCVQMEVVLRVHRLPISIDFNYSLFNTGLRSFDGWCGVPDHKLICSSSHIRKMRVVRVYTAKLFRSAWIYSCRTCRTFILINFTLKLYHVCVLTYAGGSNAYVLYRMQALVLVMQMIMIIMTMMLIVIVNMMIITRSVNSECENHYDDLILPTQQLLGRPVTSSAFWRSNPNCQKLTWILDPPLQGWLLCSLEHWLDNSRIFCLGF